MHQCRAVGILVVGGRLLGIQEQEVRYTPMFTVGL